MTTTLAARLARYSDTQLDAVVRGGGEAGRLAADELASRQWGDEAAQAAAEIAAENAWLVVAERGVDDGFEEWELARGCAYDPQSGYAVAS